MSPVNSSTPSMLGTLGCPGAFLVAEISACTEMSLVIWAEVSACASACAEIRSKISAYAEVRLVICSVKRSTASTLSVLLSVLPRPSRHDLRK